MGVICWSSSLSSPWSPKADVIIGGAGGCEGDEQVRLPSSSGDDVFDDGIVVPSVNVVWDARLAHEGETYNFEILGRCFILFFGGCFKIYSIIERTNKYYIFKQLKRKRKRKKKKEKFKEKVN